MNIVIFVVLLVCVLIIGIIAGMIIARKTMSNLAILGTVWLESEDNPDNMYMVWNMELEDVLKHDAGLVQIRKYASQNKQVL